MSTRSMLSISVMLCCACAPAHAALYQFTVGGQVVHSLYQGVTVGEPVVIQFVADSRNLLTNSPEGFYASGRTSVKFPNVVFAASDQTLLPRFQVNLLGVSQWDMVETEPGNSYVFGFQLLFPYGTLTSGAIPLTLPLAQAAYTEFILGGDPTPRISGPITSYSSVELPEPFAWNLLVLPLMRHRRRAR